MNGLTNATRYLTRSIALAAFVALLVASTARRADANQQGDPVNSATSQARTCEIGGGTAEVDVGRDVAHGVYRASVTCKGGLFDGITCDNWSNGDTRCYESLVRPEIEPAVAPTGGIEAEPDPEAPIVETADQAIEPVEATEESAVIEPAGDENADPAQDVPGGNVDGGAADDLPEYAAEDETTAPADGEPQADTGEDADSDAVFEEQVTSDSGVQLFQFEEEDEQV
jgi:hypothetical protein